MISIDESKAEELLKSFSIPPKPASLAAIHKECNKTEPSIESISAIVSEDVSLAANVLKAINSPVYGFSRTITDINQSIMFLGIKSIKTLVECFALKKSFSGNATISLECFWDGSVSVAQLSLQIMNYLDLKNEIPPEDLYASALFQDCGIPPMAMRYDDYKEIYELGTMSQNKNLFELEESHYKTNHTVVGYYVAKSWHMPENLCNYILNHHDDRFLASNTFDSTAKQIFSLLKVAYNIYKVHKDSNEEVEWNQLSESILNYLRLSEVDYHDLENEMINSFLTHS